jgi:DNA polymerase III sliding clamp (beta) subunit (PCNA family)
MARVQKGELIRAIKAVSPYAKKTSLPITTLIAFDGPGQRLMATDFTTFATAELAVLDPFKMVEKPMIPAVRLDKADLEDLKVDQLKTLAEYALTPEQLAELIKSKPKKENLVDAIYTASGTAADYEEATQANGEKTKAGEAFLICPKMLLKMASSLEAKNEDMIDLDVTDFAFDQAGNCTPDFIEVAGMFKSVPVRSIDDFPTAPASDDLLNYGKDTSDDQEFVLAAKVPGPTLARVAMVSAAVSGDDRAHVINVFFDAKNDTLVSTDGSRMHSMKTKIGGDHDFMVNAKALMAATKTAGDKDVVFHVSKSGRYVKAEIPSAKTTLIFTNDKDVSYPKYNELLVLVGEMPHKVSFSAANLVKPLEQAVVLASEEYKAVQLSFNGGLDVALQNPNTGEYERTNIQTTEGHVDPPQEVALNGRYLLDAIKGMETVEVRMKDGEKRKGEDGNPVDDAPLTITSPLLFVSPGEDGFKALVMPMRL